MRILDSLEQARILRALLLGTISFVAALNQSAGQTFKYLTEVPNYEWAYGCFGTASGNLAGFWDRHGLPDIYTGPTAGGIAPLNSSGGNSGIVALWASAGHLFDYYDQYEFTGPDRYVHMGHVEHSHDCVGDFIGLSQNKWTNLNNECRGNIDAYSFVFWDKTGRPRTNHYTTNSTAYVPDIGSGLKEWARWRGYDADVTTQLADFNPERTTAAGFSFNDLKREINAGYPVLLFLQPTGQNSRPDGGGLGINPPIHGVLAYGYVEDVPELGGGNQVIFRNSWGFGSDGEVRETWSLHSWLGLFPPRGVITFHPKPRIRDVQRGPGNITLAWDGPSTVLRDELAGSTEPVHYYVVQRATRLDQPDWKAITSPFPDRTATVQATNTAFYRVVLQTGP